EAKSGKPRLSLIAAPPAWSSGFWVPRSELGGARASVASVHRVRKPGSQTTASRTHHPMKGARNSEPGTRNPEPLPKERWLAITPAGFYDGSPDLLRRLRFRLGTSPAPAAAGIEAALHKP